MLFRYSGTSISFCGTLVNETGNLAELTASDDDGGTERYVWLEKTAVETFLLLFSQLHQKRTFLPNFAVSV